MQNQQSSGWAPPASLGHPDPWPGSRCCPESKVCQFSKAFGDVADPAHPPVFSIPGHFQPSSVPVHVTPGPWGADRPCPTEGQPGLTVVTPAQAGTHSVDSQSWEGSGIGISSDSSPGNGEDGIPMEWAVVGKGLQDVVREGAVMVMERIWEQRAPHSGFGAGQGPWKGPQVTWVAGKCNW